MLKKEEGINLKQPLGSDRGKGGGLITNIYLYTRMLFTGGLTTGYG